MRRTPSLEISGSSCCYVKRWKPALREVARVCVGQPGFGFGVGLEEVGVATWNPPKGGVLIIAVISSKLAKP